MGLLDSKIIPPKKGFETGNDFADAFLNFSQARYSDSERGETLRTVLKVLPDPGVNFGIDVTPDEWNAFKARCLDALISVYGRKLGPAMNLLKKQVVRGQKGVLKRQMQGKEFASTVSTLANGLRAKNVPEREIAGRIAKKTTKDPSYVRKVLKKKRV